MKNIIQNFEGLEYVETISADDGDVKHLIISTVLKHIVAGANRIRYILLSVHDYNRLFMEYKIQEVVGCVLMPSVDLEKGQIRVHSEVKTPEPYCFGGVPIDLVCCSNTPTIYKQIVKSYFDFTPHGDLLWFVGKTERGESLYSKQSTINGLPTAIRVSIQGWI